MTADKGRDHRDAATGQYVTDEYAAEHPDTTTSEPAWSRAPLPARDSGGKAAAMLSEWLALPVRMYEVPNPETHRAAVIVGFDLATAERLVALGPVALITDGQPDGA